MGGKLLSCLTPAELGWRWLEGDEINGNLTRDPARKYSASSQSVCLNGSTYFYSLTIPIHDFIHPFKTC